MPSSSIQRYIDIRKPVSTIAPIGALSVAYAFCCCRCHRRERVCPNFWRPVTAIRNGDMNSNDATERDPGWTSLNATPMHPEYPSQAAIGAGVAVSILESVFGPQPAIPITATDLMEPTLKRQFNSIGQMAEEHKDVRICGGIHFRNSLDVGEDMGRKIAAHLIDNALTPAR
jgi:hypothetical protein